MRKIYERQLNELYTSLMEMGTLCEDAIYGAVKALNEGHEALRQQAVSLEGKIAAHEKKTEALCGQILLRQQPVAGDLRQVSAAEKMISDMARIGNHAADIGEIIKFLGEGTVKNRLPIDAMAETTVHMVTDSIDSYIKKDLDRAKHVIMCDDKVDDYFVTIRKELVGILETDGNLAEECLDLFMIAKYFERIGDHAESIAKQVVYVITGSVPE